MVRPREFDETAALDAALAVFWRHGYHGTSITELVAATGVQRQSLYNAYRDKDGLFHAALAHYVARVEDSLVPLTAPAAGLSELERYLASALEIYIARGGGACLLVKTAFSEESGDADVRRSIERGANAVRTCFAEVVARAQLRGEVAARTSPEAAGAYLYAVLSGLSALSRTGGTKRQGDVILRHAIDSVQNGLDAEPRDRRKKTKRKTAS
jgi:TetR/AcrR family transcriptional regulator, transcriptional repressor for nem operon